MRRIGGSHVTLSPVLTMLARLVSANVDTVRYFADPYGLKPRGDSDPVLEALYERNIRAISAINRERGVATVWVGQLVNRERLRGDGQYGWLPLVRDRDVWPLLQRLNAFSNARPALWAISTSTCRPTPSQVPTSSTTAIFQSRARAGSPPILRRPCARLAARRAEPYCFDYAFALTSHPDHRRLFRHRCRNGARAGRTDTAIVLHARKNRTGAGKVADFVRGRCTGADPRGRPRRTGGAPASRRRDRRQVRPLDVVVSNAGFADRRAIGDLDRAGWDASLATMTSAFFELATAAKPWLAKAGPAAG